MAGDVLTMDGQGALVAFGRSCNADIPSEQNDPMTEIRAFLRGEKFTELFFYLFRFFSLRQPQPATDTNAMGVAYVVASQRYHSHFYYLLHEKPSSVTKIMIIRPVFRDGSKFMVKQP